MIGLLKSLSFFLQILGKESAACRQDTQWHLQFLASHLRSLLPQRRGLLVGARWLCHPRWPLLAGSDSAACSHLPTTTCHHPHPIQTSVFTCFSPFESDTESRIQPPFNLLPAAAFPLVLILTTNKLYTNLPIVPKQLEEALDNLHSHASRLSTWPTKNDFRFSSIGLPNAWMST